MATTTLQYRHKKFDVGKRSRESDFISDSTRDISLGINLINLNEPNPAHDTTSAINPSKRRRVQSNRARKTQIKKEIIDLTQQNEVQVKVKQELIELNANVPPIPQAAFEDICKFRSNMVRQFPKKERNPKEQERRDKNTFACRRSRRVKKIEQVAIEEEYKTFKEKNLMLVENAIRYAVYYKKLKKMTETEVIVLSE